MAEQNPKPAGILPGLVAPGTSETENAMDTAQNATSDNLQVPRAAANAILRLPPSIRDPGPLVDPLPDNHGTIGENPVIQLDTLGFEQETLDLPTLEVRACLRLKLDRARVC